MNDWFVDWKPEQMSSGRWRAFATRDREGRDRQVIEAVGDTLEEALANLPARVKELGHLDCFCGCCSHGRSP